MSHSPEMAARKPELWPSAVLGCPAFPCDIPSHPQAPPIDTAHLQKHTPRPPTAFVYPLTDHTGHTGPRLMKTTRVTLTQTLPTGTHCPQTLETFQRDSLESHMVTTHRYTPPHNSALALTLRREHAAQTSALSIHDEHTVYIYLLCKHQSRTHHIHCPQTHSYPIYAAKT